MSVFFLCVFYFYFWSIHLPNILYIILYSIWFGSWRMDPLYRAFFCASLILAETSFWQIANIENAQKCRRWSEQRREDSPRTKLTSDIEQWTINKYISIQSIYESKHQLTELLNHFLILIHAIKKNAKIFYGCHIYWTWAIVSLSLFLTRKKNWNDFNSERRYSLSSPPSSSNRPKHF